MTKEMISVLEKEWRVYVEYVYPGHSPDCEELVPGKMAFFGGVSTVSKLATNVLLQQYDNETREFSKKDIVDFKTESLIDTLDLLAEFVEEVGVFTDMVVLTNSASTNSKPN